MNVLKCTSAGDVLDRNSVIQPGNVGTWNNHPVRFKGLSEGGSALPVPYKPFVTAEPGQRISITTDIMSVRYMVDVAVKQKNYVNQLVRTRCHIATLLVVTFRFVTLFF